MQTFNHVYEICATEIENKADQGLALGEDTNLRERDDRSAQQSITVTTKYVTATTRDVTSASEAGRLAALERSIGDGCNWTDCRGERNVVTRS